MISTNSASNSAPRKTVVTKRRPRYVPDKSLVQPYLIVMLGSDLGRRFRLFEGSGTIGRSRKDCEVFLEEPGLSRCHAQVTIGSDQQAFIQDLGSTNGTLLNGRAVGKGPTRLQDGDKIQLGDAVVLEFRYQSPLTASLQEHIYSSAVRDSLTGLYNKAYLTGRLEQELAYAVRHDAPLALVVIDFDHFKRVNDVHGHAAGDYVLEAVSRLIEGHIRNEDLFARYGGEEFVLLMRLGVNVALRVADRIRRLVAELPLEFDGKPIPVTISMGLQMASGERSTPTALFSSADANLYSAKDAGRNCVCGPKGIFDPYLTDVTGLGVTHAW